jgi:hypothetical protein
MKYKSYARDNGVYDEHYRTIIKIQPVNGTKKQSYEIAKIACGIMNGEIVAVPKGKTNENR